MGHYLSEMEHPEPVYRGIPDEVVFQKRKKTKKKYSRKEVMVLLEDALKTIGPWNHLVPYESKQWLIDIWIEKNLPK